MGSLMAGWGSKSATLKRNRSLTKDEIDAYWKSKKKIEEEHLQAISSLSDETVQGSGSKNREPERKFQKSITMPVTRVKDSFTDTSLEQLIKKNGWWTKSNWAFLNEPPVSEGASNKYAAQFHVANLGSSRDGISTA
ncbi:hypothetical protein RJT34_25738 [Clitoria ternatea]|uniref:Uncharacterized protein n=1 Tax=Clitoria ternatea TaxID=43366 RepID=A0AAN9FTA3_CLITE